MDLLCLQANSEAEVLKRKVADLGKTNDELEGTISAPVAVAFNTGVVPPFVSIDDCCSA